MGRNGIVLRNRQVRIEHVLTFDSLEAFADMTQITLLDPRSGATRMRSFRLCLVALGFLLSMHFAAAQRTGVQLLEECQLVGKPDLNAASLDFQNSAHCAGYLSGMMDTLALWNQVDPDVQNHNPAPVCIPDDVTVLEAAKVVVKYLNDHPISLHDQYAEAALLALSYAYPCKQ